MLFARPSTGLLVPEVAGLWGIVPEAAPVLFAEPAVPFASPAAFAFFASAFAYLRTFIRSSVRSSRSIKTRISWLSF
jgi:hypothetical protein